MSLSENIPTWHNLLKPPVEIDFGEANLPWKKRKNNILVVDLEEETDLQHVTEKTEKLSKTIPIENPNNDPTIAGYRASRTCTLTGGQIYSLPGITDEDTQQGIVYLFNVHLGIWVPSRPYSSEEVEEIKEYLYGEMVRAYIELLKEKRDTIFDEVPK